MTPEIKTEIPPLKLRLLKEEDAKELSLRVDQNREHLRRWASWVDGTTTTADTLKFVRFCLESAVKKNRPSVITSSQGATIDSVRAWSLLAKRS
jgi:hypothetical protein